MSYEPQSLQDAVVYFSNPDNCIAYLSSRRWPDGKAVCPGCGSESVSYNANRRTWKCSSHHAKREFSIKVGTIMEDSAIPLDKWLVTMWLVTNCKNGISSYEIARDVEVTQKSAWFMLHRIRLAMQDDDKGQLCGEVEADETFIGGKARNMHKSVHERRISGMGQSFRDKAIVMGILERGGRIRTQVIADRQKTTLQPVIRQHVEPGSALYTDEMGGYKGLDKEFLHEIINHAVKYVDGRVHTNGTENFWSLLKRGLGGTYVSVEPFHLFRYLDEQVFRYCNRSTPKRKMTDADRFDLLVRKVAGKRLTFAELTGKVGASPAF
jgi:transposase-like protein